MTANELVLGVPRQAVLEGGGWRGVRVASVEPFLDLVAAVGAYRPRAEVEDDPTWKQVIPYLVLHDGERLFLMRRTRAGGDSRLYERYSLGIGGHVNPPDGSVVGGLRREWAEEVDADFEPGFVPLGLLNDDTDPVGAVHLGVVYTADAAGRRVTVREHHKLEGWFAPRHEVHAVHDRLETWSQLLLEFLVSEAAMGTSPASPAGESGPTPSTAAAGPAMVGEIIRTVHG
ncbi:NUDIX domain-containing protein [soil metagenome]